MQDEKALVIDQRGVSTAPLATEHRAAKRRFSSEWLLFLLFVGPNLLLFGIFTYWPLVYSFYLSRKRWDFIAPVKRDVGWDNFRYLWENDNFHKVMWNTFWFTLGAVGGSLPVSPASRTSSPPPESEQARRQVKASASDGVAERWIDMASCA